MNCNDISEMTVDFLYGELDQSSRREFDAHLAGCEACRREVESYGGALSQTRALLSSTVEAPPPAIEAHKARMSDMVANRRGWPLRTVGAPVIPEDAGGFWTWLRKPWLVPALAAAGVITLFLIAREAITPPDRMATPVDAPALPAQALRDEQPAPAPVAAGTSAPAEPAALDDRARALAEGALASEAKEEPTATGRGPVPRRVHKAVGDELSFRAPKKRSVVVSAPAARADRASAPVRQAFETEADSIAAPAASSEAPVTGGGATASAGAMLRRAPAELASKRTFLEAPAPPPSALGVSGLAELAADGRGRATADSAKPGAPPAPPPALIELGARLFAEGRLADAAVVYQNLLERYPAHPQARLWKERLARAGGAASAAAASAPAPTAGVAAPPAAAPADAPAGAAAPSRPAAKAAAKPTQR